MSLNKPNEKIDWGIKKKDEVIEVVENLGDVLKSGNVDDVSKILQDKQLLRSFVIQKGEGGKNLQYLNELVDFVIKDEFGQNADILDIEGEKLISLLHEREIPEQVLGEMLSSAYHMHDRIKFFRIYSVIMENSEKLHNKELIEFANHDLASWYGSVEKDSDKSQKLNKEVLDSAKMKDLKIIATKAKFGITFNRDLKPKEKAQGFAEIRESMEAVEHHYDAHRARIEEIKALVELASRQKSQNEKEMRFENIDRAIALSKEVLDYAIKSGYSNLEVLAREAQALIAKETGDIRRSEQFSEKARELKEKYLYK